MQALLCAYPSKPCVNKRSNKDDGTLHRLCSFHRQRANDAQRRWHARQRLLAVESGDSSESSSAEEIDSRPNKRRRSVAPRQDRAAVNSTAKKTAIATAPMTSPVVVETAWFESPFAPTMELQVNQDEDALLDDDWITEFFAEMDGFLNDMSEPMEPRLSAINPLEPSFLQSHC